MDFKKINISRIIIHVLFWTAIQLIYTLVYGNLYQSFSSAFYLMLLTLPVTLSATYFSLYYMIPKLLLLRKFLKFAVYFIYTSLIMIYMEILIIILFFIISPFSNSRFAAEVSPQTLDIWFLVGGIYFVMILASLVKIYKHWGVIHQENIELSKEKLAAELQLLKSQLHPHFLFNTLNNLYALTLKKSEDAPDVVMRMSNMLRYILYECSDKLVPISGEIELIENYIALESIRYSENLSVNFQKQNLRQDTNVMPLIFLPFVENAFKHGASQSDEKTKIDISLEFTQTGFRFCVVNANNSTSQPEQTEGIGLKNIQKRLDLFYKDKYKLDIQNYPDTFKIELEITLE